MNLLSGLLAVSVLLSGCTSLPRSPETSAAPQQRNIMEEATPEPFAGDNGGSPQTGLIAEQVLDGAESQIHYSYYLPEDYDSSREYPMMVVMPGYDMMWFGEDSSGSNLNWSGFRVWTKLDEEMIVVSAQLTDWGQTSARQAIELTEYFLEHFSVDRSRVYAAGYSAGGETMSQAVSMRPDLYAAYLHGASKWDGTFTPVAENRVAVYIFMAENDEYYGSQRARDAYNGLYEAYQDLGLSDGEIDQLLQAEIPDNEWFREQGVQGNYHGGGNVLFDQERIRDWITSAQKPSDSSPQGTGFSDVATGAWYADAVEYVRDNGLMSGTTDTTFSPDAVTSRGMLATILYRAKGSPAVTASADFSDVSADAYYADAAAWASENGIISGYGNGRFGPNDPVTREQIAAILWRYAGSPSAISEQDFADEGRISAYAADAADWARNSGIITGVEGTLFLPKNHATRAQIAVMLRNYMEQQK